MKRLRDSRKRTIVVVALAIVLGVAGVWAIHLSGAAPNPNLKGDINNSNRVDITDLSLLLGSWNQNSPNDLNGDGRINISDLSLLLGNWNKTYSPTTPPTPPTPPAGNFKPGFVYRDGGKLMLDGKVWRFAGVNDTDLAGCNTGSALSDAQMDQLFSNMPPSSMVRTWAFQEWGTTGLDRAVKSAEKYGQKMIFSFADGAEYCNAPDFDKNWYVSGYKGTYFNWVTTVVNKYKASPAIGAWEIMNEPGQEADGLTESIVKSFYDTTAAKIKSLDPDHLVATGALAPWQDFQSGVDGFANVHSGPNIDLLSLHEYDYAYENNKELVSNHFDDAYGAAKKVNKPIFIGETGINLSSGCMTGAQRAAAMKSKYDAYFNAGANGVLYWRISVDPDSDSYCNDASTVDPVNGPVMNMIKAYRVPGQ